MKKTKWSKWLFFVSLIFSVAFFDEIVANAVSAGKYIRSGDFSYCEHEDGTISIEVYHGTDETLIVPSEIDGKVVSEIGRYAFDSNSKLKTVNIPSSVKTIGEYAFFYCTHLESVFLSEGIEKISRDGFTGCKKLKIINIPNSVKTIEKYAFSLCESLENITIPSTVTSIESITFYACHSLTVYTDSNSPLMIGWKWFSVYCIEHPQIIKDEAISPTCTQDGKTRGGHCSICDYKVEQKTIKAIGHSWNAGVITTAPTVSQEGTKTFTCKYCNETKTETIPKLPAPTKTETISDLPAPTAGSIVTQSDDSYKVINSEKTNATVEYSKPKKSKTTITIPDTVKIDGFTYKVTSISKDAFKNNKKIKKVIIGKNITKIGANAFSGCKNLKTITVKSTKLKSVGKNAFKGIHAKAKIKVPKSKLKKYKNLMSKKGQKSSVKITK